MPKLLSKRNVRLLKIFLVSENLEKVLLVLSASLFLLIEYSGGTFQTNGSEIQSLFLKQRLDESLSKVTSLAGWFTWIEEEVATMVLNANASAVSDKYLLGSPRFFNVYLDYPTDCLTRAYEYTYSSCIPTTSAEVQAHIPAKITPPSNPALCFYSNCSEFYINKDDKLRLISKAIDG